MNPLLSDVDWFAAQELTKCLKPVHDMYTAIQLKKLTTHEFFGEWLKCKVQLLYQRVNNACYLALALLHAMDCGKTTLSNATFLAAIYVDPRYSVLLKHSSKTVAQAFLAAL